MSPHSRLAILVLLLTLSNLGTSFAAAYLAKDTSINDKEELVHANSKQTVSTQTTAPIMVLSLSHRRMGKMGGECKKIAASHMLTKTALKLLIVRELDTLSKTALGQVRVIPSYDSV